MADLGINIRRLRELRQEMGWTQEDLARASGLGRPMISRIESGARSNVRSSTLHKLAKALHVPVDDLMLRPMAVAESETPYQNVKRQALIRLDDLDESELKEVLQYIRFLQSQRPPGTEHVGGS